jgi:3-phosphoshikimate 1-carboxyvinyltransferase
MAALAGGVSHIENPLDSLDAESCAEACRVLGAAVGGERAGGVLRAWTVRGTGAGPFGSAPRYIDAGNSGTTLFFTLAAAALGSQSVTFTGDAQIAKRSASPLLEALRGLGVSVSSENGRVPITVRGPWKGGRVSLPCPTSQYLSALLLAAPLAPWGIVTEIDVPLLNERPYVEMTLEYLKAQGLSDLGAADFSFFRIEGGASYRPLDGPVPADFSSAAFPAAAALVSGGSVTLLGLDPGDSQGDKVFFEYLERMGAKIRRETGRITVLPGTFLHGGVFDLNATPDMLPVMAVLAAFAEGPTELINAAHARIKETDRIAVMTKELAKFGVKCVEKPDGMVIYGRGAALTASSAGPVLELDGHGDHRVVMALACAALGAGPALIDGAGAADVTYPEFLKLTGAVYPAEPAA